MLQIWLCTADDIDLNTNTHYPIVSNRTCTEATQNWLTITKPSHTIFQYVELLLLLLL